MKLWIRCVAVILAILSLDNAAASRRLGVDDYSVVEYENGKIKLIITHVLLGAGTRDVVFKFQGCGVDLIEIAVPYNPGEPRASTELELTSCTRTEPVILYVYFREPDGSEILFQTSSYDANDAKINQPIINMISCMDDLFISANTSNNFRDRFIDISYEVDGAKLPLGRAKIIIGHGVVLRYPLTEGTCDSLSGIYFDDVYYPRSKGGVWYP